MGWKKGVKNEGAKKIVDTVEKIVNLQKTQLEETAKKIERMIAAKGALNALEAYRRGSTDTTGSARRS